MRCRHFRQLILTTRDGELSGAQLERVSAHRERCEACARCEAETRAAEQLLRSLGETARAPEDFTGRVMARVRVCPQPAHGMWFERVFGAFKAPAPAFSLRKGLAVAAVALMVASAGVFVNHGADQVPSKPGQRTELATSVDREVDEMVYRHEVASSTQLLPDDEGMRLVSN